MSNANANIEDALFDPVAATSAQAEQGPSKAKNIASLLQKKKSRNIIYLTGGAVLLVVAFIFVAAGGSRQQRPEPAVPGQAEAGFAPSLQEDPSRQMAANPQYRAMVDGVVREQAQAAANSGQSYQAPVQSWDIAPTPANRNAAALDGQQQAAAQPTVTYDTLQSHGMQQASYQPAQPDPSYMAMQERAAQMIAELNQPKQRGLAVYTVSQASQPGQQTQASPSPVQVNGGQGQPQAQGGAGAQDQQSPTTYTLIGAGAIESVRIDSGINTDYGADFVATLVTGRYAGARLVGSYQRSKDRAVMQVRSMTIPGQGVTVPANAVILDATTREAGTATEVDRKLLTKYVLKPLAAGVSAVGEAARNQGTTTIIVDGTQIATQEPMDSEQVKRIVAGSAAQQIAQDAEALDTTPTVRVAPGTIAGVLFVSDVLYTPNRQ